MDIGAFVEDMSDKLDGGGDAPMSACRDVGPEGSWREETIWDDVFAVGDVAWDGDRGHVVLAGPWSKTEGSQTIPWHYVTDLVVASSAAGPWVRDVVAERQRVNDAPTLAARDGVVHVAWWDTPDRCVFYATQAADDARWTVERVECSAAMPRLLLDRDGQPLLFMARLVDWEPVGPLLLAVRGEAGGWEAQEVADAGPGNNSHACLDVKGFAHIAYRWSTSEIIHHAWQDGEGWHGEVVSSNTDEYGDYVESLACAPDGTIWLAVRRRESGTQNYTTLVSRRESSGWAEREISQDGVGGRLGVARDGVVHFVYGERDAAREARLWHARSIDAFAPTALDPDLPAVVSGLGFDGWCRMHLVVWWPFDDGDWTLLLHAWDE